jgi:hypothetical protein
VRSCIIDAYREDGNRLKACQNRDFQAIVCKFPKQQRSELEVEWPIEGEAFRVRQIVTWNPEEK